ncbi:MAG TPA: hypothetical protein VHE59_17350 [Mucilaginibacter sp.]|nr:hypothetical protein [Mucilaginibacter sp.]
MKTKMILTGVLLAGLLAVAVLPAMACEACKKQQPKLLQGIAHGPGPDSSWDYLIVSIMVVITIYSFYAMVKHMAKSRDKAYQNIKSSILN